MGGEHTRGVPPEEAATLDEIQVALATLSDAALIRLRKYAAYRIRGLGRKAGGRDHDDLLQDALQAVLEGRRRWPKGRVGFEKFLKGIIQSMASHWGESFRPESARSESELTKTDSEGGEWSPYQEARAEEPDPSKQVAAKEELALIEKLVEDDDEATLILEGLRKGQTGVEIREDLGLSQKEYDAAIKRLRRRARSRAQRSD